jgi:hypothetical protein
LLGEQDIPFANQQIFAGLPAQQVDDFLARCSEIGKQLIDSTAEQKRGETDDQFLKRKGNRRLGYGNRAMLLASPFNVPTQTLTMIWASGKVDGTEWLPLMPRRKKI